MKSKKIRSLFCAAALTLSLAACGSKTSDCSGQTITGEITDIDGTAVTMQLGELSAGGMPSHDVSDVPFPARTPPDKLDGETASGTAAVRIVHRPTQSAAAKARSARAAAPTASRPSAERPGQFFQQPER